MSLVAECKHCRARLDTSGKSEGDALSCQCGALVFVVEAKASAAPSQVPLRKDLKCPRCTHPLHGRVADSATVYDCASCGGTWLSGETFDAICRQKDARAAAVTTTPAASRVNISVALSEDVKYIPCPTCNERMNRQNFAKVSGVIVDVCKQHGVWLDKNELSQIVQFIENGGMMKLGAVTAAPQPSKLAASSAAPAVVKSSQSGKSAGWEAAGTVLQVAFLALEIFADLD